MDGTAGKVEQNNSIIIDLSVWQNHFLVIKLLLEKFYVIKYSCPNQLIMASTALALAQKTERKLCRLLRAYLKLEKTKKTYKFWT